MTLSWISAIKHPANSSANKSIGKMASKTSTIPRKQVIPNQKRDWRNRKSEVLHIQCDLYTNLSAVARRVHRNIRRCSKFSILSICFNSGDEQQKQTNKKFTVTNRGTEGNIVKFGGTISSDHTIALCQFRVAHFENDRE